MPVSQASERDTRHGAWLELFALDRRSLGVFRVGIGFLIAYDTLSRFIALPGVEGAAPSTPALIRAALLPLALLLVLGVRARLVTVLCWLIYAHGVRSGLLGAGGSVPFERYAITLALFWGMFLPLDRRATREETSGIGPAFFSMASAGLTLQVILIYFSAGITKYPREWLVDRSALLDILGHPGHGTQFGQMLTEFPQLLSVLSVATVTLEVMGPILFLVPGRAVATRRIVLIGLFVAFHLGLALTLSLGIFPWVMIAIWSALLPSGFWDGPGRGSKAAQGISIDRSVWRNVLAGTALTIVIASNLVTWLAYPATEGLPDALQTIARQLALYQQWTMFSVPSSL